MQDIAKETSEAQGFEVKTTYIEKGYDIGEEISKQEWADLVITQTPVYWFNTPWIYERYIDEFFTTALVQGRILIDDGRTRFRCIKAIWNRWAITREKIHVIICMECIKRSVLKLKINFILLAEIILK